MSSDEPLSRLPLADAYHAMPVAALNTEFDTRWAAWVRRGHAHEQLVRRKLVVLFGMLATVIAIVYIFMH